jgi:hypothetical protein
MKLLHRTMALVAALAAVPAAWAQAPGEGKAVEIEFEFSVGMLGTAFGGVSTVRLAGDRYLVDSRFYKLGLAKALTASFTGSNRAWGSLATSKAAPSAGWSWIEYKGATRTWQVDYIGDPFREAHAPPFTPKPDKLVTAEQKRGAVDPLNAGVLAILANGSSCNQTLPVFDSKRRFDVIIAPAGQGRLKPSEIPGAEGDAQICSVVTRPIAGYEGLGRQLRPAGTTVPGQARAADRLRHGGGQGREGERTSAHRRGARAVGTVKSRRYRTRSSSTCRTLAASWAMVNGFGRKATPGSSVPSCTTALRV